MNTQLELFNTIHDNNNPLEEIVGLKYIPNYITPKQEYTFIQAVDKAPWINDLKRRVQHYGYKYDYRAKRIDISMKIGSLPKWVMPIAHQLQLDGYFDKLPDQLIINEYLPGQGITPHIDCEPCFEDTIISLSLGSDAVMEFTHDQTNKKIPLILSRCSLAVLKGDSRYLWKHSIPARKSDKVGNTTILRSRRISLTFRRVIL